MVVDVVQAADVGKCRRHIDQMINYNSGARKPRHSLLFAKINEINREDDSWLMPTISPTTSKSVTSPTRELRDVGFEKRTPITPEPGLEPVTAYSINDTVAASENENTYYGVAVSS